MFLNNKDLDDKDDAVFWGKFCDFIVKETKGEMKLTELVTESIKNFDFSDENIHKISKVVTPYQSLISPGNFTSKCPTAGLFCFIVKDVLEYIGVLVSKRPIAARLIRNVNYELNLLKNKTDKMQEFLSKLE